MILAIQKNGVHVEATCSLEVILTQKVDQVDMYMMYIDAFDGFRSLEDRKNRHTLCCWWYGIPMGWLLKGQQLAQPI